MVVERRRKRWFSDKRRRDWREHVTEDANGVLEFRWRLPCRLFPLKDVVDLFYISYFSWSKYFNILLIIIWLFLGYSRCFPPDQKESFRTSSSLFPPSSLYVSQFYSKGVIKWRTLFFNEAIFQWFYSFILILVFLDVYNGSFCWGECAWQNGAWVKYEN